jgi:hypothetical protein
MFNVPERDPWFGGANWTVKLHADPASTPKLAELAWKKLPGPANGLLERQLVS